MYQNPCPLRVTNTGYKWVRDYIHDKLTKFFNTEGTRD